MKRLFFYFWAVLLLLCGASLYAADHFSDAVLYLLIVLAALWGTIGTWTDVFSSTHTKPFRRRFLSGLFHFATIMCFTLALSSKVDFDHRSQRRHCPSSHFVCPYFHRRRLLFRPNQAVSKGPT